MRNSLVAALVAYAEQPMKSKARRFLAGLSSDELQFIAGFLGSSILESHGHCTCDRSVRAPKLSADEELKMILLVEYLCCSGLRCSGLQKSSLAAGAGTPTAS